MQDPSSQRLILVLQAPTHAQFIQELLAKDDLHPEIMIFSETQAALDFLQPQSQARESEAGVRPQATRQRPDLILLDLELAGKSTGYELLKVLKNDPSLRRIPIIVLTLSDQAEDIFQTYVTQGNCYVVRPGDSQQLMATIRQIEDFWLRIVTLPRE
jgi:two-component system, chemotaxis family, response regulator Rcp1